MRLWRVLVLVLVLMLVLEATAETKDSTGLVGTSPALLLDGARLPLQFWANSRRSALKPRKRDLHEPTLMALLGDDYDPAWMNKCRPSLTAPEEDGDRVTVRALRSMMASAQLPAQLPAEYKRLVEGWLVTLATCPIRFVWDNLGPYFWPRWVRRGECSRGNSSCSWPPGMSCQPRGARNLHVLRWHCRLRKHHGEKGKRRRKSENQVWNGDRQAGTKDKRKKKKRRKYRCFWIKVPYPVPEDCVCTCADKDSDGGADDVNRDR